LLAPPPAGRLRAVRPRAKLMPPRAANRHSANRRRGRSLRLSVHTTRSAAASRARSITSPASSKARKRNFASAAAETVDRDKGRKRRRGAITTRDHLRRATGCGTCRAMDIRRVVGLNLRRLRVAAGLSQDELAARTGSSRIYISGIENGRRNPTVMAAAINCSCCEYTDRNADNCDKMRLGAASSRARNSTAASPLAQTRCHTPEGRNFADYRARPSVFGMARGRYLRPGSRASLHAVSGFADLGKPSGAKACGYPGRGGKR